MRSEFEFWYPFDLRVSGESPNTRIIVVRRIRSRCRAELSTHTHTHTARLWGSDCMPG
jgi:hypothetical protein